MPLGDGCERKGGGEEGRGTFGIRRTEAAGCGARGSGGEVIMVADLEEILLDHTVSEKIMTEVGFQTRVACYDRGHHRMWEKNVVKFGYFPHFFSAHCSLPTRAARFI